MKFKFTLLEALNILGADFVGSENNFDLYDIRTWDAAQRFRVPSGQIAGDFFVNGGEPTFLNEISESENAKLYFFTEQDQNIVLAAALFGHGGSSIQITDNNGEVTRQNVEYQIEVPDDQGQRGSQLNGNLSNLPLNLLNQEIPLPRNQNSEVSNSEDTNLQDSDENRADTNTNLEHPVFQDFIYKKVGNHIEISRIKPTNAEITIPETIDNYQV